MNCGYVMELRDLEYFAVVAEHGNLGRAAELLGLSQPALSKSIARLEDAMEVKLFRRTAKGMDLTAEGSCCCRVHANSGSLFGTWRAKCQT